MTEPAEARGIADVPHVQVPVDLVELEARLLAAERRLREQEARDQLLLGVAEALRRLTDALGPMLEVVKPQVEPGGAPSRTAAPAPPPPAGRAPLTAPAPAASTPAIEPQRLALAQARLREAVPLAPLPALAALSSPPPPGRRSWLLRALRRMVSQDPESAGRLLVALLPGHRLAQIEHIPQLPGSPATVARVVVKGRLRRRLGWEMAQLTCDLGMVSALAQLVRTRASPAHLHAVGVRLDPPLTLALVALTIDPHWTLGHRFTLAHLDAGSAYLEVRNGARPSVSTERPPGAVATTVRCSADALLPLFAGESGVVATVEGAHWPLELVQGWFADATSA